MMHASIRVTATLLLTFATISMAKTSLVYIATQDPEQMGIAAAEFDSTTGKLSTPKLITATRDPAHFALSADGAHLYMCNTGTPGGVSAFAVDRKTRAPRLLNHIVSQGRGPSYVSLDASGRYVLDANYGGGYVEVLSLAQDGSLGQQTAFVQHTGSSIHARQNKPYAHWIGTDPSNRFALVADLGTDRIVVYKFDAATGTLAPHDPPAVKVAGGMGPRHLVFHPNGKWVYGTAELANEVMAFNWDTAKGTLTQFQSVRTLAEGFAEPSTAAEIAVHANGKFLFASNRGEDTLVVYAIDPKSGELSFRQRISSRGKVPRYFTLDPSNQWLLVSNQESGNIAVFRVDANSGALSAAGDPVSLNRPMAVVFAAD
jgi:6-phosphogluconolactonase